MTTMRVSSQHLVTSASYKYNYDINNNNKRIYQMNDYSVCRSILHCIPQSKLDNYADTSPRTYRVCHSEVL